MRFVRTSYAARFLTYIVACVTLTISSFAQTSPTSTDQSPSRTSGKSSNSPIPVRMDRTCVEPAPVFMGIEYNGPFKKLGARLAGQPEIKTVEHPHNDSGRVCSLPAKAKFRLFVRDTFEPATFIIAGFNAGIAQASDDDPTFGQGAEGYGRRYGAAFADGVSGEFWGTFFYPTLLHEDPRYYRWGYGPGGKRLFHALEHSFVTHRDSGKHSFNFSEWMATSSTVALGNLYHPGNRRGFEPAATSVAYGVAYDMGFDVLREFWPEVSRHFHLPFVRLTSQPTVPPKK